jgi:tRNA threonylcarbamoyladenosine biosynthesis protein TsaB
MNVLAFDSSFSALSVTVLVGDRRASLFEPCTGGHAERLLPLIERALTEAGTDFSGVDRIATTLGPGGFTGLRAGLSIARALALATGCSLVAVDSLSLLARTADVRMPLRAGRPLFIAMDARKGALYFASYTGTELVPRRAPCLLTAQQAMADDQDAAFAVGSGAHALAAASDGRIVACLPDLQPDAVHLAALAPSLTPLSEARPLYLRAADARPQIGKSLARA